MVLATADVLIMMAAVVSLTLTRQDLHDSSRLVYVAQKAPTRGIFTSRLLCESTFIVTLLLAFFY